MARHPNPDEGRAYQHLDSGRKVLASIRGTLDHCALFKEAYAITSRVKSVERMMSKVTDRRSNGNAAYSIDSLTDTVGVRIITQYRDEVPHVVRNLFCLITGSSNISPNYLAESKLVEFLEYVPHMPAENDPLTAELREIYNSAYNGTPPHKFEPRPRGGYSSVHLVLRFPAPEIEAEIGVEFQIRTVFEDAWGQIDHKLAYEQERRLGEVDQSQRDSLKKHLAILKKVLDAASDYADVIKNSLSLSNMTPMSVTRSLDNTHNLHTFTNGSQLSKNLQERIFSLIDEKRRLDLEFSEDSELDVRPMYLPLADELYNIAQSYLEDSQPEVDATVSAARVSLRISLMLESALCRFLSEDRQQVRLAIGQYKAIAIEQPDNPVCWFRQGQALAFLAIEAVPGSESADTLKADFDRSYERARESLEKFERGETSNVWLSEDERQVIRAKLAMLHGFALWRVVDIKRRASPISSDDVKTICRAYEISFRGILAADTDEVRVTLINNALYFASDAHESSKVIGSDVSALLPDRRDLLPFLEELFDHCHASTDSPLRYWDTLAHAAELLDDHVRGKSAAAKVLDLNAQINTPVSEFGSAYAFEMGNRAVQHAWRIYREGAL